MRILTAALVLGLAAGTGVAEAANRHVDIINKTGMTLTHFYASKVGVNDWEEDILGRDSIANGDTFDINIDDGTGACRFDFKAVFENGASIEKNNINVCEISSFTYNR